MIRNKNKEGTKYQSDLNKNIQTDTIYDHILMSQLEEQKKSINIFKQMAHDMGSPLMALSVLQDYCHELPENKRNMLRESIKNIREIANSILSKAKPKETLPQEYSTNEILVYPILEQLILDKQLEYQALDLKFEFKYNKADIFDFVKVNPLAFKRMLSNLVNNSVDACEGKYGIIRITLESSQKSMIITIEDNGKGMSQEIINTLMCGVSITHNKKNGLGIGFTQIRDTVHNNNGELIINSEIGVGTKISIIFSKSNAPEWITKKIELNRDDIIVILDDDPSIHKAWDIRFNECVKQNSKLQIKHFTLGREAISFINELDEKKRNSVLLLTDYELLGQKINGLYVIDKVKPKRAILVTNYINDKTIGKTTSFMGTKILPKTLASSVLIKIEKH